MACPHERADHTHAEVDPTHLLVLACTREQILACMCIMSSGNTELLYLNPELKRQQCDLQTREVQCVIRLCPAYTWARLKSKRNLELLPLSLVFIKSLYALVQLAVPAKSCKSCCVPGHKLGWDGSAVWWGLHNTHAAYIWLKALLLIPHFHEHKTHILFFFHSLKNTSYYMPQAEIFLDSIKFLEM